MTVEAFAKAVGGALIHITAASNLPLIREYGLRPAARLAQLAGIDPHSIILRKDRECLSISDRTATLNHQLPIRHGLNAARKMLDGYTPEEWAKQLDERIFFWPKSQGLDFAKSVKADLPIHAFELDAKLFADLFWVDIDLCPINSGNFTQGGAHAPRGDWIYTPLSDGLEVFRSKRIERDLKKGRDSIKEISLKRLIDPQTLAHLFGQTTL